MKKNHPVRTCRGPVRAPKLHAARVRHCTRSASITKGPSRWRGWTTALASPGTQGSLRCRRNLSRKVRETRTSSSQKRSEGGEEVLAERPVGYPWPESWGRNLSGKVRETRSSNSQKQSEPAAMHGQAGGEHGGPPWFKGTRGRGHPLCGTNVSLYKIHFHWN